MEEIILPAGVIGAISAILTELCKFFPVVNEKPLYKAGIALALTVAGTLIYLGQWDTRTVFMAIISSLVAYRQFIQPAAKAMDSRTQSNPQQG